MVINSNSDEALEIATMYIAAETLVVWTEDILRRAEEAHSAALAFREELREEMIAYNG